MKYFYTVLFSSLFTLTFSTAQSKLTHCTVANAAGEKFEGYIKYYTPERPNFSTKNFKLHNGKEFKKIFTNHIQLIIITSDSAVYKPRVDAKNKRRLMRVMQENEDFSVYVDFPGRTSGAMADGFSTWVDYHYYFVKDGTKYQLPYNKLRISPSTYFETVEELILAMKIAAREKNVVLPDYIANYKKTIR